MLPSRSTGLDPRRQFCCAGRSFAVAEYRHRLRPDPERDNVSCGDALGGHVEPRLGMGVDADRHPAIGSTDNLAGQEVHLGRTDEAGDEQVVGPGIEFERRPDLLDAAIVECDDPVGQRHRFDLVVRDVDHGGPEFAVQPLDLEPHLHAQRCIEVRQRFVEQEHLGIAYDGAPDSDALGAVRR